MPLPFTRCTGLVLYLFLVGIEMDPEMMLKNARKTIFVALSGVGLPFALGFAMSPYLFKVRWIQKTSTHIYIYDTGCILYRVATVMLRRMVRECGIIHD